MTEAFEKWIAESHKSCLPFNVNNFRYEYRLLSAFVREIRRTAVVVRDGDPSDCYWTGFALEELVRDFGLEQEER